jgi:hypothetical protein
MEQVHAGIVKTLPRGEQLFESFVPASAVQWEYVWSSARSQTEAQRPRAPGDMQTQDYGWPDCGGCFGACGPNCDYCIGGWLCYYDPVCYAHDLYCCLGGTVLCAPH